MQLKSNEKLLEMRNLFLERAQELEVLIAKNFEYWKVKNYKTMLELNLTLASLTSDAIELERKMRTTRVTRWTFH